MQLQGSVFGVGECMSKWLPISEGCDCGGIGNQVVRISVLDGQEHEPSKWSGS